MKVLAVMGSPRKKGNTYRVVEKIEKVLLSIDGTLDFEYLFLKDQSILMCTGCFTCFAHGEDRCPLQDDLGRIKEKMAAADGIILAAPTYAMGVPALMKNLIDRLAYTCHRPDLFDKVFLTVTTVGASMGMKISQKQLAMPTGGGRLVKKLGIAMPPIPMGGSETRTEQKIKKAAWALYKALNKKRRKLPGLSDWAWFHSFKTLCKAQSYKQVSPADCAYYGERDEYFYPIAGHPVRRMLGRLFGGLMRLAMGGMTKKRQ